MVNQLLFRGLQHEIIKVSANSVVLKLFWLKYPFKKKNQAKYPLTTQCFALKYSEMIGSPEAGEPMY